MTDSVDHASSRPAGSADVTARCRIVEVAERLFRQIGYQKTTVSDIARALKMSPANVYRFFDSKKSINAAVASTLLQELEVALTEVVAREAPAAERLRAYLATMYAMNSERLVGDYKLHEMVTVAITENWDVIEAHVDRVRALIEKLIVDGQESGEFSVADAHVASHCVLTGSIRFCHPELIAQCAKKPGPTLDQMADFLLAALGYRGNQPL